MTKKGARGVVGHRHEAFCVAVGRYLDVRLLAFVLLCCCAVGIARLRAPSPVVWATIYTSVVIGYAVACDSLTL